MKQITAAQQKRADQLVADMLTRNKTPRPYPDSPPYGYTPEGALDVFANFLVLHKLDKKFRGWLEA